MRPAAILAMILVCRAACGEGFARVTADLEAYDAHVASLEAGFARLRADPHDRTWVKAKLRHMVEVDQYMRKYSLSAAGRGYSDAERRDFDARFAESRWAALDRRNAADLERLLEIHGWFKISSFGEEADNDAWLLVQHADLDRELQRRVLAMLEPLAAQHETRPEHYAYLFDRLAAAPDDAGARRPQRYGTQGHCIGKGRWEPYEVEDPAHLDERRASVGLAPMAEYLTLFVELCFEAQDDAVRKPKEAPVGQTGARTP